jgi:hypothetical protein
MTTPDEGVDLHFICVLDGRQSVSNRNRGSPFRSSI